MSCKCPTVPPRSTARYSFAFTLQYRKKTGNHPFIKHLLLFAVAVSIVFLPFHIGFAETVLNTLPSDQVLAETPMIPSEYGEVIYQYNGMSPNQLYIVGTSHRNTITRANGKNTPKVRVEVYRIGEWLIKSRGLELLLPEGFFARNKAGLPDKDSGRLGGKGEKGKLLLAGTTLEDRFANNSVYLNAEMLLIEDYRIRFRQVEDRMCYDAVGKCIRKIENAETANDTGELFLLQSELEYLQEKRTAAMLQNIPVLMNDEFKQGRIKSKRAMLTIGLNHIHSIISSLKSKKINIYAPLIASEDGKDFSAELDLMKEDFGITVIIPRTLVEDQGILKMTRLDEIIAQQQGESNAKPSAAMH